MPSSRSPTGKDLCRLPSMMVLSLILIFMRCSVLRLAFYAHSNTLNWPFFLIRATKGAIKNISNLHAVMLPISPARHFGWLLANGRLPPMIVRNISMDVVLVLVTRERTQALPASVAVMVWRAADPRSLRAIRNSWGGIGKPRWLLLRRGKDGCSGLGRRNSLMSGVIRPDWTMDGFQWIQPTISIPRSAAEVWGSTTWTRRLGHNPPIILRGPHYLLSLSIIVVFCDTHPLSILWYLRVLILSIFVEGKTTFARLNFMRNACRVVDQL